MEEAVSSFDTNQYWIDLLSEKEAENQRLRAALEQITVVVNGPYSAEGRVQQTQAIAREALAGDGE
jgi:hypothetical protein